MLGVMLKPNRPQIRTRSDTCQATMTKDQVQHGGILYSPTHGSWDLPNHQLLIPKAQILCCESVAGCIHCYSHLFDAGAGGSGYGEAAQSGQAFCSTVTFAWHAKCFVLAVASWTNIMHAKQP